jgi:predicted alpha/beta hydrolase family esterase
MTNVILLHGKPDDFEYFNPDEPTSSNNHWNPWLQKQCQLNELMVHAPEVHHVFDATYEDWVRELDRYDLNDETIVVAHSCGGGILLRYLSENRNVKLAKLILVAPWTDPLDFMKKTFGFDLFDFEPDPNIFNRVNEHVIFHSDNDQESVQLSVKEIQSWWPEVNIRIFHNFGHFCREDGVTEFPELLEEVLS